MRILTASLLLIIATVASRSTSVVATEAPDCDALATNITAFSQPIVAAQTVNSTAADAVSVATSDVADKQTAYNDAYAMWEACIRIKSVSCTTQQQQYRQALSALDSSQLALQKAQSTASQASQSLQSVLQADVDAYCKQVSQAQTYCPTIIVPQLDGFQCPAGSDDSSSDGSSGDGSSDGSSGDGSTDGSSGNSSSGDGSTDGSSHSPTDGSSGDGSSTSDSAGNENASSDDGGSPDATAGLNSSATPVYVAATDAAATGGVVSTAVTLSTGAIVGIAIGALVLLFALIAIIVHFARRNRRQAEMSRA